MKYLVMTLLFTLVSGNTFAKEYTKIDFENLMTSYLSALVQKDEEALSKVTSERFLKKFKQSGQLKQVFKAHTRCNIKAAHQNNCSFTNSNQKGNFHYFSRTKEESRTLALFPIWMLAKPPVGVGIFATTVTLSGTRQAVQTSLWCFFSRTSL